MCKKRFEILVFFFEDKQAWIMYLCHFENKYVHKKKQNIFFKI